MILFLDDGKPRKLTYTNSLTARDFQSSIQDKEGETLFWHYHKLIVEDMFLTLPADATVESIWKKLTIPQKGIFVMGHFISQVNNGGVWQFMFNKTEYATAVAQFLYEICEQPKARFPYQLKYDYKKALEELYATFNDERFNDICEVWNNAALPFEERWAAFNKGYAYITQDKAVIQSYFYKEDFKAQFYTALNAYIEHFLGLLINIVPEKEKAKISKKEAIPHFTQYLTDFFKTPPQEVSVYYTAKATIDLNNVELFLMKFVMPDGTDGMGITGYFTHLLDKLSLADIKTMYQKWHKQELVNIYYAYYLVEKAKVENTENQQVDESKWAAICVQLNVPIATVLDYIKLGGREYYVHDSADIAKNPVDSLGQFKNNVSLISTDYDDILAQKYPLYFRVFKLNQLVKDNPWGF